MTQPKPKKRTSHLPPLSKTLSPCEPKPTSFGATYTPHAHWRRRPWPWHPTRPSTLRAAWRMTSRPCWTALKESGSCSHAITELPWRLREWKPPAITTSLKSRLTGLPGVASLRLTTLWSNSGSGAFGRERERYRSCTTDGTGGLTKKGRALSSPTRDVQQRPRGPARGALRDGHPRAKVQWNQAEDELTRSVRLILENPDAPPSLWTVFAAQLFIDNLEIISPIFNRMWIETTNVC
ncbi:hypothetical protein B0T18DRAFT_232665 [Schizothecium vesticola]|uniref:Uncharacterized protein n=1 Tax=Schizothecium vesticola TaxID=314040 RepID=A0AA40K0L1_9PEZI|nr:hypothetical protein B0T18DRAFT_232665 [Schizothecium vesticola]